MCYAGVKQPLYANAPPKPRRLNTSRDYSSSPDRSPERDQEISQLVPAAAMYDNYSNHEEYHRSGRRRPVSSDVMAMATHGDSPQLIQNAERRTPDAYGRFKSDYEDVYNNSSHSSGSSRVPKVQAVSFNSQRQMRNYAAALNSNYPHRSEVARRVPSRPHSADFLELNRSHDPQHSSRHDATQLQVGQSETQRRLQSSTDYWSEESYAQQVRQSSVLRNYPRSCDSSHSSASAEWKTVITGDRTVAEETAAKNGMAAATPRVVREEEISRDVKESALWSYVAKQSCGGSSSGRASETNPIMQPMKTSNSQENLLDSNHQSTMLFNRSASARLPRLRQPDVLNTSLPNSEQKDIEIKRIEQVCVVIVIAKCHDFVLV